MDTSIKRVMKQEKRENNRMLLCTLALYFIGVIFILSSSSASLIMNGGENITYFMDRQLIFGAISFITGFIIYKLNTNFIINSSDLLFIATILILLVVLFIAPEINGAKSWLKIGGFSLQPAEFAKITLILLVSKVLKGNDVNNIETYKKLAIYTLPILVLVVLQKDLGTVMIMGAIIICMMYLGGIKESLLLLLIGIGILGVIGLSIVSPYRMQRILIFVDPFKDYYGMGYQIIQSLYSIATGGFLGQGLGESIHKYGFLPENHTDFIFSVIVEEIGLVGAIIVLSIFILLITQIFKVAFRIRNKQISMICAGIGCFIAIESLLNLLVVVSLMPVTGVTLPFISYGGSSLISKSICVALVMNINRSSQKVKAVHLDKEVEVQETKRMHERRVARNNRSAKRRDRNIKAKANLNKLNQILKNGYRVLFSKVKNIFYNASNSINQITKHIFNNAKKRVNNTSTFKSANKSNRLNMTRKKYFSFTNLNKEKSFKNVRRDANSFRRYKNRQNGEFLHRNERRIELDRVNLNEVYYQENGFNNKPTSTFNDEHMNEIDLSKIDIKKFNS